MSVRKPTSPTYRRYSSDGFEPLNKGDATIDIPLQNVPGRGRTMTTGQGGAQYANEKTHMFHHAGRRRSVVPGTPAEHSGHTDGITRMGIFYNRVLGFSAAIRYFVYVLPLGIILAIPIIIGATAAQGAYIGDVRIVWIFAWLECCWVGLWISKLIAHWLPKIFEILCGVVSSGTRKYSLVLKKLEIPLSLVGWALVSLATFKPIMTRNPDTLAANANLAKGGNPITAPHWESIVNQILAAALIASLVFLGERLLIQLITVNYHRRQFNARIKDSKHQIYLLGLLYDASRAMFPPFCDEFVEEDSIISDTLDMGLGGTKKRKRGHGRSGSVTPMRLLRDAGRFGDKVTAAFGNMASEVTGKQVFQTDSAHSIIVEALEKNSSCEALAKRIWLSFVVEGHDALYLEDVIEVLGEHNRAEAEEAFYTIDNDGNGDISLDEMILTVTEFGRERHSIAKSLVDVDQAINALDGMLCVVVFIVVIFIFIAFLNQSFVTTLATAGTALLSLSFVFSATAQEILGSCIFLFVKHPYDIGDRVDLNYGTDQLVVDHVSLLFTEFKRVNTQRTVQIPNIVMNSLWVENVTRSKAMREQISIFASFDTTLEDVQLLRNEMQKFVTEKDNARDFQPEIEVAVIAIHEMDKLELQIEARHKSNWANETLRAARRSKFMCALVLALRRVPIYGPGGGDPGLGARANPSYSVAITDGEAAKAAEAAMESKESARLIPTRRNNAAPASEAKVNDMLNERNPALDGTRDAGTGRDDGGLQVTKAESNQLRDVRGLLSRTSTKGKRRTTQTSETSGYEPPGGPSASYVPRVGVLPPTPTQQAGRYVGETEYDGWEGVGEKQSGSSQE